LNLSGSQAQEHRMTHLLGVEEGEDVLGGDSAGSSGNFSSLFDGQSLTAEEQALLKELKQREKEQKFQQPLTEIESLMLKYSSQDQDEEYEEDDEDDDEEEEDDEGAELNLVKCDAGVQPDSSNEDAIGDAHNDDEAFPEDVGTLDLNEIEL